MLKGWVLITTALLSAGIAMAEEGDIALLQSGTDIKNTESLQRGARNFMNYCSGCHSLKYLRYNRLAADLNIPESELPGNLMFTSDKVFDTINSAMPKDAEAWFGKQPPDLSLMARERGVDYIYSFLKGFYADKTHPWGVNNLVLPGAAMPHVLASLGWAHGSERSKLTPVDSIPPSQLSVRTSSNSHRASLTQSRIRRISLRSVGV